MSVEVNIPRDEMRAAYKLFMALSKESGTSSSAFLSGLENINKSISDISNTLKENKKPTEEDLKRAAARSVIDSNVTFEDDSNDFSLSSVVKKDKESNGGEVQVDDENSNKDEAFMAVFKALNDTDTPTKSSDRSLVSSPRIATVQPMVNDAIKKEKQDSVLDPVTDKAGPSKKTTNDDSNISLEDLSPDSTAVNDVDNGVTDKEPIDTPESPSTTEHFPTPGLDELTKDPPLTGLHHDSE